MRECRERRAPVCVSMCVSILQASIDGRHGVHLWRQSVACCGGGCAVLVLRWCWCVLHVQWLTCVVEVLRCVVEGPQQAGGTFSLSLLFVAGSVKGGVQSKVVQELLDELLDGRRFEWVSIQGPQIDEQ